MSSHYTHAILTFGISLSIQDLKNQFLKTTEGKFHFEKRFNPKTGQKIEPEKVWEEFPISYFELNGEKIERKVKIYQLCQEYPNVQYLGLKEYSELEILVWLLANSEESERKISKYWVYTKDQKEVFVYLPLKEEDRNCFSSSDYYSNSEHHFYADGESDLEELLEKKEELSLVKKRLRLIELPTSDPKIFLRVKDNSYYD